MTPIFSSLVLGHTDIFKILHKTKGVDARLGVTISITFLKKLAHSVGREDAFNQFIASKNLLDAKELKNFTLCHYAAIHSHKQMMEFLLLNQINPNICAEGNITALELAEVMNHREIVDLLHEKQDPHRRITM